MIYGWPSQLTWHDFQAVQNPGPGVLLANNGRPIVARVALNIQFDPNGVGTSRQQVNGQWRFACVMVYVIRVSSQMMYVPSRIPRGQEQHYLQHEQGHLDLMGLFAYELDAQLRGLTTPTEAGLLAEARIRTLRTVENARQYAINTPGNDCQYDRDTNHGMNHEQQHRWNAIIQRNLSARLHPNFTFRT